MKKSLRVLPNKDKTPQEKQTQQILNNPSKYKDQPAPVKETQNNTNQSGTTSNNDPDNNSNIDALNIYKHPEIYSNRGF